MTIAIARSWPSATMMPAGGWPRAALGPTYGRMAILPPTVGPRAALKDLSAFLRQRSREQILGAAMAVLVTIIIVIIFFVDSKINTAPPEQIVYVESYAPGRTDEQIKADQQKASEQRRKAEKARQEEFQKLEKKFGIE